MRKSHLTWFSLLIIHSQHVCRPAQPSTALWHLTRCPYRVCQLPSACIHPAGWSSSTKEGTSSLPALACRFASSPQACTLHDPAGAGWTNDHLGIVHPELHMRHCQNSHRTEVPFESRNQQLLFDAMSHLSTSHQQEERQPLVDLSARERSVANYRFRLSSLSS